MDHQRDSDASRRRIETHLVEAGWVLESDSSLKNATVDQPSAVRGYVASNARIDYALCISDRVIGLIEQTRVYESLSAGLDQARSHSRLVEQQPRYQARYGVPFLYSTDGIHIDFLDVRMPQNRTRRVVTFHTPDALNELVSRDFDSELAALQSIPMSHTLRHYQAEAIRAMEAAIAAGRRNMILSMAQGTGKTATAVNEVYRLLKADIARRVLLLQDNRMLAAQTTQAFNSLEVEPGVSLATAFTVHSSFQGAGLGNESTNLAGPSYAFLSPEVAPFVQVSTVSELTALLNGSRQSTTRGRNQINSEAPQASIHTFDLIVAQDCDRPRSESELAAWRQVLDYFDAIKIGISSVPSFDGADEFDDFVVYRYGLETAVRDGSLVKPEAVKTRPTIQHWQGSRSYGDAYERHSVFLSYAYEDAPDATFIAQSLREQGVNVRPADYDIFSRGNFSAQILNELRSQDTFVILLSPANIGSPWVENQLDAVVERRGVEVIPGLLKPCPVPRALADRTIVDITSGIQGLLDCLQANARIDLRALSPRAFENLAQDLLQRLYFDLHESERTRDHGYDFRGVFQDPLGFADPTEYLIEVKSHRSERSSVNVLQAFANVITSDERHPRGLLVTSGHLTSVAMKVLRGINEANIRLLVIDGLKFKNLLLRYPDLIARYFPPIEIVSRDG